MDSAFDSPGTMVRDSARAFAQKARDFAALRNGRNRLPWHGAAALTEMAGLGWFAALIPESQGGIGLGLTDVAAIAEELGEVLLAEPIAPLAVLAPRLVMATEDTARRDALLAGIADGSHLLAVAWQEGVGDLADPAGVATRAEQTPRGWRLSGEKRFVACAWAAKGFVVSARAADGLRLFLVAADAANLQHRCAWRADGSPAGHLILQDTAAELLTGPGSAGTALVRALDEAALIASAEAVGLARAAFDLTVDYMRGRVAFGRPLTAFQALQHRVAELLVQRTLAEASLRQALALADGAPDANDLSRAASRAKLRCTEAATLTTRQGVQLHGAMGFTDDCDIGLFLKRAMLLSAFAGTPAQHRARFGALTAEPAEEEDLSAPPLPETMALLDRMHEDPVSRRDWNALSDTDFRAAARAFFSTHCPQALRFVPYRMGWAELGEWYLFLSRQGWLAPTWPARYGGMGLSPAKLIVFYEEAERIGAPRVLDHGINNVGSILLARGTEEQRQHYLPRVLSGEHIWCQGYSEPNAGSDLASLRTQAVPDGDEFVVTGQKIWTSFAHEANHIYALVRTDPAKPGRDGISFLLIDLRQPGVRIRPIPNITGRAEFCEVFLDGVRTHRSNMIGGLNEGWAVSRAVLGFERLRAGMPRIATLALNRLRRVGRAMGLDRDPLFQDKLAQLACDVLDCGALYQRLGNDIIAGIPPGPEASVLKIVATELEQRLTETLAEALGEDGTLTGIRDFGGVEADVVISYLFGRCATIYGGTTEIQKNIIARRILAL